MIAERFGSPDPLLHVDLRVAVGHGHRIVRSEGAHPALRAGFTPPSGVVGGVCVRDFDRVTGGSAQYDAGHAIGGALRTFVDGFIHAGSLYTATL